MRLRTTKNDLMEAVRLDVIKLLNSRLADCIDLQTQTKQAHWNVRDGNFINLHKLFVEINESIEHHVETIADRAVQLGGPVHGTARAVAARSSLAEYPLSVSLARDHVAALTHALAAFSTLCRKSIGEAAEFGDPDTADVFTDVSRGVDKWLWLMEALVEAALSDPSRIDNANGENQLKRNQKKSSPVGRR